MSWNRILPVCKMDADAEILTYGQRVMVQTLTDICPEIKDALGLRSETVLHARTE